MNATNEEMELLASCYLSVDCFAIKSNLEAIRKKTKSRIMAVVKHDGYGLSLIEYARLLTSLGVEELAAGSCEEALALREAGITAAILLLTPQASVVTARELIRRGVMLTVGSARQAETVRRAARETGIQPKIHIKIDTGLGRYGFLPDDLQQVGPAVRDMDVRGAYTHFSSPYAGEGRTRRQYEVFLRAVEQLKCNGVKPETLHCCASGSLLRYPDMHLDLVRAGSALIGRVPDARSHGLAPAVALNAGVISIRQPGGFRIGYRGSVGVVLSRRIGILSAGCSCELAPPRRGLGLFKARRFAMVNGTPAEVLGPLGIGALAVDLSGVRCVEGDFARLEVNPLHCPGFIQRVYEHGREGAAPASLPILEDARHAEPDRGGRVAAACKGAGG